MESIVQNYNVCMEVGRLLYCFANEREVAYMIPMTSVALLTLVDNIFASSVNPLYTEFHFLGLFEAMDALYNPYF